MKTAYLYLENNLIHVLRKGKLLCRKGVTKLRYTITTFLQVANKRAQHRHHIYTCVMSRTAPFTVATLTSASTWTHWSPPECHRVCAKVHGTTCLNVVEGYSELTRTRVFS